MKQPSPSELLEAAYTQLEFEQGCLLPAADKPASNSKATWVTKGDWQALAEKVGAERIFFVGDDPVAVFARLGSSDGELLARLYNRAWCMARPLLLFIARPGELAVYDLTKAPLRLDENIHSQNRLLGTVIAVLEVQTRLAEFHRERLETGALFGEERFRESLNRADRALIRDLKTVRSELAGVPAARGGKRPALAHLHSLIGRVIFVRYLEDRKVLQPGYFDKVAGRRKEWIRLLQQPAPGTPLDPEMGHLLFPRVLQNQDFTYALFDQLAEDFNGDTFPVEDLERASIHQGHLDKLRGFLLGDLSAQASLFFYAYRFDVIPIELISSIYEEFYNEQVSKERNQGSHYTPPALVEFVLAHTLTPEVLATMPRVLDPACGSGIFLVEAFRRMVRHLWSQQGGRRPSRAQLLKVLREQVAGMDINEEAIRVAAFSLYLAFLHYQDPPDILAQPRLPHLKWVPEAECKQRQARKPGAEFFEVLLNANAFTAIAGKLPPEVTRRFGPGSATVVVGNPPWGYPKRDDTEGQQALCEAVQWCAAKSGRPIGDKELSQAFIHLALELLQDGGKAGLLVSSGVFFKHHENSRSFRRVWLTSARLEHVVNFAHVRQVFFSGPQREAKGISPFASVVFEKMPGGPALDSRFEYWSAKRTALIEHTQCVVLNQGDMHWLSQRDCLANEKLWKIYWWGGHRDAAMIGSLNRFPKFEALSQHLNLPAIIFGQGFTEAKREKASSGWLRQYKELPADCLTSYGPLKEAWLRPVPLTVKRKGKREVYEGDRLLVRQGIADGRICARLIDVPLAFRNSVHGVLLTGLDRWQQLSLLGIFWSSLPRYYYFATAGSWGLWHDQLHLETVGDMPIRFPNTSRLRNRIAGIVEELQRLDLQPEGLELAGMVAQRRLPELEHRLDDAIFDLYELNPAERDLVREMCSVGLDLFYRHQTSAAASEVIRPQCSLGRLADVAESETDLSVYLRTFLEIWNDDLAPDGEFIWRVLSPPSRAPLLAVSFTTHYRNGPLPQTPDTDAEAWRGLLARLEKDTHIPAGSSRIFTDTFIRHVSEHEILLIKRNEQRFWTRTAAREDAEAAFVKLANLQEATGD